MIEWCREEMLCPQPVPLPDIPHDSQVTFEVSLPIILSTIPSEDTGTVFTRSKVKEHVDCGKNRKKVQIVQRRKDVLNICSEGHLLLVCLFSVILHLPESTGPSCTVHVECGSCPIEL